MLLPIPIGRYPSYIDEMFPFYLHLSQPNKHSRFKDLTVRTTQVILQKLATLVESFMVKTLGEAATIVPCMPQRVCQKDSHRIIHFTRQQTTESR